MAEQHPNFCLVIAPKAKKQLTNLSPSFRKQYEKAFQLLCSKGPSYRSLRTHRYQQRGCDIWGSSASMFLRFYWIYVERETIEIVALDSH
jgi:hypothetical protein